MDERFRGRGIWIGLGALALIFLCVMMCGLGSMAMMGVSRGAAYVAPPAVEDGAALPPAAYGYGHHGPFGFLGWVLGGFFKLAVFSLLLLVVTRLVMGLIFGRHFCGPRHWRKPPKGEPGDWGPPWHAWHKHHHRHWPGWGPPTEGPSPQPDGGADMQEGEPDQDHTAA